MALAPHELARRGEDGQLRVRAEPLRLRWQLDDLVTSDGHRLCAVFSCAACLPERAADRQMLEEALLAGRSALTVDELAEHFRSALISAAAAVARRRPAAEWLETAKPEMCAALRSAATNIAFASGIEILPPVQLDVRSPTLRQQALESTQRRLAEQRSAGRVEHLRHAVELLAQFESLRAASPHLRFGELLNHISPADQGPLLEALTRASAGEQSVRQTLGLVAGPYLFRIDLADNSSKPIPAELPTALGPLRSVQSTSIDGARHLLIGARGGVIVLPDAQPEAAVLLCEPHATSALGFNRVVSWNGGIWACHGEAGLIGWSLSQPNAPREAHRPPQLAERLEMSLDASVSGPRHLHAIDDARLMFAMGSHLVVFDRNSQVTTLPAPEPQAPVAGIVLAGDEVIVAHEDGHIDRRRRDTLESIGRPARRGQRIIAAAALPWLAGEARLLIADDRGPVTAIGLDDTLITQYLSDHQGARMLAACASHVAAVSIDRQRLILWNSWDGAHPRAEIAISALAKHRIADIDMI